MLSKLPRSLVALALLAPIGAQALPMDWHGVFGVDSTMIDKWRRISQKETNSVSNSSMEPTLGNGKHATASWQSYIFRLNPTIVVNDSASFKAEFTTGYGRGGRLGDSMALQKDTSTNIGQAMYGHNFTSGNGLNVQKLYAELYSDTATYLVGRHTSHWGLGAIYNSGDKTWDHFASSRDGITMKVKIGNFNLTPFYSKVSNTQTVTRATGAKEYGTGLLYDNPERDITFGVMYALKTSDAFNGNFRSDASTTNQDMSKINAKVTDIYLRKIWGKFDFGLEIPIYSGDLGYVYNSSSVTKYHSKGFIFESNYQMNDVWKFGVDAGIIYGHDGTQSSFNALYLNPNYQIANLLFRYNLGAFSDPSNKSVYDSYITNATYIKARAEFVSEKWILNGAFIWAKADQTATAGKSAYNHMTNKVFTANYSQSNDLGKEIDFGATYKWNTEVAVAANLGYLMTGDYYAFTNTATSNTADNSLLLQINTSLTF